MDATMQHDDGADGAQLRATAGSFLSRTATQAEARCLMATGAGYNEALWRRIASELGWQGLAIPERYGGAGHGCAEMSIVFADLTAARGGGGCVVRGDAAFVLDGHVAGLVPARANGAVSLFAVGAAASGVRRTPLDSMDHTRKLANLSFVDTPACLVGTSGDGSRVLSRVLDRAAVALAAEQVEGASRCLVDYAKTRVQFDRPIGSFQAVKHKCADMLVAVESARSALFWVIVLIKGVSVLCFDQRSFAANHPDLRQRVEAELLALLATGRLRPRVTASFPLDRVQEALQTVADRRVFGKAVVSVAWAAGSGGRIRERLKYER